MNPTDEQAEKQLRILKIITWAMMVVMPVIYLVVAQVLDTKGLQARAGNELLVYLLLAVSVLSPLMIPLVMKSALKSVRTKLGPGAHPAPVFQSLSIIQMAFVEAIYIYGFVAFQLTGKITNMLYFYPIGIAWSFVYWPRREKYDRLVERLNQP